MGRYSIVTAFLTVIVVSAAISAIAAPAMPRVTSTLDGETVLPSAAHWIATPHVPASEVREVDFLIDGKLRWIELKAPFAYGGDDEHNHLGYLFTSWLAPGKHTFTVRVRLGSGKTATDAVDARVRPPIPTPARLAGTWTRVVTSEDVKKATSGQAPPAGRWRLVFDRSAPGTSTPPARASSRPTPHQQRRST